MTARHITTNPESKRAKLGSDLLLVDGWGFVAGQLPIDLASDRAPLPEMVEAQMRKILANLGTILAAAALTKESVV
jgi:enamine deaminase RidA (YjgF/YER057c/UK114 family)